MLVHWRSMGIKSYIYSSGSREAQNNLFGHTTAGDLRPYLYGFFDTRVGPKVNSRPHLLHGGTPNVEGLSTRLYSPLDIRHPYRIGPLCMYWHPWILCSTCSRKCISYSTDIVSCILQVEAASYKEISLSLGVDSGDEVLFATDILAEAVAAKEAGWNAVLVSRPGNKPLPADAASKFRIIESLEGLLPFM